jgi:para-aminobenzoate synthetase/4-amino-4-deoxychorismate lyase
MTLEKIIYKCLNNDYSAFFYTPVIYKDSYSYLFTNPETIITASNQYELFNSLDLIDKQKKMGRSGYGYLNYEAGYYLENKFQNFRKENENTLLKFCFFDNRNVKKIKSDSLNFLSGGFEKKYIISELIQNKSKDECTTDIKRIKKYIEAGDAYQVNYTFKCKFKFEGSYTSLLKSLIFNQSAQFTTFINDKENIIISLSPELFFSTDGQRITCKPMKGTVKRGINLASDIYQKNYLKSDQKFHAENLMILDLLRNDLGKISEFNSVHVDHLFKVEKYESLFQLVSEVSAQVRSNISWKQIFASLFPCGSVTGAPKIRTMEIINQLENGNRGLYTGSIGLFMPDKTVFNVSIRTLTVVKKNNLGELGIGSGITWDSEPLSEYNETLLKSKFLTDPDEYFELFETMLIENGKVSLLNYHLDRLKQSADYFLFVFDEENLKNKLSKLLLQIKTNTKLRLKLILNKWGNIRLNLTGFPETTKINKIIISKNTIDSGNKFQYFKTTNRKLLDHEHKYYSNLGFFDVIFFNEANYLAEGAITSIFTRKDGNWYTPSLDCGILPGVYRRYFLEKTLLNSYEKKITYNELLEADEIILTNSLRGEIKVDELILTTGEKRNYYS